MSDQIVTSGEVVSGAVIRTGDTLTIASGGVASFTTVSNGGFEFVNEGGIDAFSTVASGGFVFVNAGATASGTIISGGFEYVSGGSAISTTVDAGGNLFVSAGGFASSTIVSSGGSDNIGADGIAIATRISAAGAQIVSSGGVTSGTTIGSGGTEYVRLGGFASGAVISNGGFQIVSGGIARGTVVSSGGTEYVYSGGSVVDVRLLPGGTIDLATLSYDSGGSLNFNSSTDVLTVTEHGVTHALQLTGDYTGEYFTFTQDAGHTGTAITASDVPCYCRGTMILTPDGEVAVEDLKIGDLVTTLGGSAKPIKWIGMGRNLVTPANEGARPIIVRKDAIADEVPSRDLYLTRGHALYLDDVLIPVEHLVNGRSVLWDMKARVVEFYHIELPSHDVLIANGAPAESYKDDGNREAFLNHDQSATETSPCDWFAPVLSDGPVVEGAWRRLLHRSGFTPPELTQDPDLHLVADDVRIDAATVEGSTYRYHLTGCPSSLRIVSRSAAPRTIGCNLDARRLGVAVRSITLNGPELTLRLPYDSHLFVGGFHPPEHAWSQRWTDGSATIPSCVFRAFDGRLEIALEIVGTTSYPIEFIDARRMAG